MEIGAALSSMSLRDGDSVDLSGWPVDQADGLYVLEEHYPENYLHPVKVRIENGNIIYPILNKIPALAGGWSRLFYRAKISGIVVGSRPFAVHVNQIAVEGDRETGVYQAVDVSKEIVDGYVASLGNYDFGVLRNPMRDWLDDA
jgi:hypothetical protein